MSDLARTATWSEADRLAELHGLSILDTPAEESFDEITSIATHTFATPICFVSLLDSCRQWFKSVQGSTLRQTARDIAFCDVAIHATDDVMVVHDALLDPRFKCNPLVVGDPRIRFYAGAPLITGAGHPLGTLCVLDTRPRSFGADERRCLRQLANQVTRLIEYRGLSARLLAAQQSASAQRALLEAVIHHTASGITLYDEQGDCILANQAMCRITGGSERSLLAQNIHRIEPWRESGIYDCAMRCLRTGQPQSMTSLLRRTSFGAEDRRLHVNFATFQDGGLNRLIMVLTDLSEAEKSRERAQRMQDRLIEHMLDGLILGQRDTGAFLMCNPAAAQELGYEPEQLRTLSRQDLFDPDDPRLEPLLRERDACGGVRGQVRMRRSDGSTFEAEISSALFESIDGLALSSTVFRDVTQRDALQNALAAQSEMFRNLAEHAPGMLFQYRLTPQGTGFFPFSSEGIQRVFELRPEDVGQDAALVRKRVYRGDLVALLRSIRFSAQTLQHWQHEYRVLLPQAGMRWLRGEAQPQQLEDGSVLWHGYIHDITERKQAERRTNHLAYYDALTQLPNRSLLLDRLDMAIRHTARVPVCGAVLYIDLDRFKQINDARGHSQGDKVLVQVAQRLRARIRNSDTTARLGGDEFVVLLGDLSASPLAATTQALDVAEQLLSLLVAPLEIDDASYVVSASIGIALFANGAPGVDDVLSQADIAMYRAKASGRNRVVLFEPAMQQEAHHVLLLDHGLRQALERQELRVEIQSQTDAQGRITGGECLLRWHHPQLGALAPSSFIPIAEDNGSIVPIGAWVLESACTVLATLARAGIERHISVNLSVQQLRDEGFLSMMHEVLERTGAPPQWLILEVTESLFIRDVEATCALLERLTRLGIQVSIDDFGTGYSSLRYLQRLPIHELKIDRSFVDDLPGDEGDANIVRTIVAMARQLGLRVIAEGVETRAQVEWLRAEGCDSMQGWYFSRPVALKQWLSEVMATAADPAAPNRA